MVEIILTVFCVSFICSWVVICFQLYYQKRQLTSKQLVTLNDNLAKVGLYWSNVNGDFAPLTETSIQEDHNHVIKSTLLLGVLSFLSLLGLMFLIIIIISLKYLARSKREKAVFCSELVQSKMSLEKTNQLVAEFTKV